MKKSFKITSNVVVAYQSKFKDKLYQNMHMKNKKYVQGLCLICLKFRLCFLLKCAENIKYIKYSKIRSSMSKG